MGFSRRGEASSKDISVFLFDDNSLFLESLSFLLNYQKGIKVAGRATSIEEARQFTRENPPEVVILGMGIFKKKEKFALLSFWQAHRIPVIVLGLEKEDKEEALKRGAAAFFRKGESYPELLATIREKGGREGSYPEI